MSENGEPKRTDTFLNRRELHLLIGNDISANVQEALCANILYLNALSDEKITVFIDSKGGSMQAGQHLHDMIAMSSAPVEGIVIGQALSSAFVALQACHTRLAYPNARLMYHAPLLSESPPIDQKRFEDAVANAKKSHEEMIKIITSRSNVEESQLREWSMEERVFGAEEALKLGFIDEIAQLPKRSP